MSRSPLRDKSINQSFVYEAVIVSHLDPTYMGKLEVELLKSGGSDALPKRTGQLITVKYLSPFYGVTSYKGISENNTYRDSQQSYGFWAVPPDVGTRVLVVFAEGNTSNGYWIGCIQDEGMNYMVPDGRPVSSNTTPGTPDELIGKKLPVGEYNKLITAIDQVDTTPIPRPYNFDFTQILEVQGLIDDETRGQSTSSARREVPSMVFGISTPGPLDKRASAPRAPYGTSDKGTTNFSSRLGGSSFVMDDGDPNLLRATHAADGPPYYVNKRIGEEGGDETIPHNEGIRLRTRTGHQILLSNSEDLIYIGNSRGTAWIELTSDGKIDIFANDSISVYSEQDFNFTADRDINFDAGRNINMWASARWSDKQIIFTDDNIRSGEVTIMGYSSATVRGGESSSVLTLDNENINIKVKEELRIETAKDFHLAAGGDFILTASESMHLTAGKNLFSKANNNIITESQEQFNQVSNNLNVSVGANYRENIGANRDSVINGNNNAKVFATNNLIVAQNSNLLVNGSMFTETSGDTHSTTKGSSYSNIEGDQNTSVTGSVFSSITGDQSSSVSGSTFSKTLGDSNVLVSGASNTTVSGDMSLQGANINMDSSGNINQNTGASSSASTGGEVTSASSAKAVIVSPSSITGVTGGSPRITYGAYAPNPLNGFASPRVIPGVQSEEPLQIITICTRVPQHEPWPHHENLDPVKFKPEYLDRELMIEPVDPADRIITPETLLRGRGAISTSTIVSGSGGLIGIDGRPITPGGGLVTPSAPGGAGPLFAPPVVSPGGTPAAPEEPGTPGTPGSPPPNPSGGAGYLGGTSARAAAGGRADMNPRPTGNPFGTSQGVVGGNLNGRNYGQRREPVDPRLIRILEQAARYSRIDVHVEVPGQIAYNDPRAQNGVNRTGSRRHDRGFAVDMDLRDNGRNLNINNGNDVSKMITFVRAFRDFARQAGERPAGAVGNNYMGSRMHLDIAWGNSVNHNAYSYHWQGTLNKAWMFAIMYGNGPNDGQMTPDGRMIGWDA